MLFLLEILFLIIVFIQVLYYFLLFSRFAFFSDKKAKETKLPISIIVCAKNEAENLAESLPSIISQKHDNFEIILVNDHSTDDTLKIMRFFAEKHSNIKIVNLTDAQSNGNKKNAITQGVKLAKFEYLLFTDADCVVYSDQWINEMTSHFTQENEIVLGYGAYEKTSNSWLNKLVRFETLLTAIQYFSYAKANLAYMGVGRNLAYKKTLFLNANGFESHKYIKSGDDDLFINQVAKNNVAICFLENSFTYSKAHTNLKKWIYQKRRHVSTANAYKLKHKILLGLFYVSQFLFWFLTVFLMIAAKNVYFVVTLFVFRIVLQYLIYGLSAKKLKEADLILYLPFLELFLIMIQMRIFMGNIFSKPVEWEK